MDTYCFTGKNAVGGTKNNSVHFFRMHHHPRNDLKYLFIFMKAITSPFTRGVKASQFLFLTVKNKVEFQISCTVSERVLL